MSDARLLLVDDDPHVRQSLRALLGGEGFAVQETGTAEDAILRVRGGPSFSLVVTDLHLPGASGLDLLRQLRHSHPDLPAMLITGFASASSAVEFLFRIRRLLHERALVRENDALRTQLGGPDASVHGIVGRDAKMAGILDTLRMVAPTRATVLLHGESGTGKTMMARAIHLLSDRRGEPFVEVACGAIPEELIESELFGHVRGAFTGALTDRQGKIESAHGGTLFLDEVAVASPALQVKLLRVLQERAFERLGSTETTNVDIRLILATNRDLEAEVKAGRFREDLYYRIQVVSLDLPPLRERKDDIPLLARTFLERHARQHGRPARRIDASTMDILIAHAWPGNVRELENVLERAVIFCDGPSVLPEHLAPRLQALSARGRSQPLGLRTLRQALEGPEREHLIRVLRHTRGNRQDAAEILGVNRSTLFNKMRKHALFEHDFQAES